MFSFEDISFRPIKKSDLKVITDLKNDESTFLNLGTVDMYDAAQQEEWLLNISKNTQKNKNFTIVTTESENILGVIRIYNIDPVNSNCEIGVDIVKFYRNKGYGTKSYNMVLKYLFEHLNINMAYLKVIENNEAAIPLYEKIGFIKTGYFKDYMYRYGKYWNYNIMCITKNEFYGHLKRKN